MSKTQKINVFLCHASQDKSIVRELYKRLSAENWIDPWLDEEKLLPGQDWDMEIEKAVETSSVVLVCLSSNSITKDGYVQRELRFALRFADEKPEGAVFVIPVRLDDSPVPRRLRGWQYVDYFPDDRKEWVYKRLLESIKIHLNPTIGKNPRKPSDEEQSLINLANDARKHSYAPYSHYRVGAALKTKSGRIYTGVNVESAAYPTAICAERVAVFKAVADGEREFDTIAVVTENGGSPCGSCRQVLAEFGLDTTVLIANGSGKLVEQTTVADLLPGGFTPDSLI
jgi:cytidine deaminase